jgi:hypothetical protein
MGNTLQCNEVLCSENIYELEWINEKNWNIESYDNNNKPNNETYKIINGNFKIFNKSINNYKLIKKIENINEIEKIYIHFLLNYNLNNENNENNYFDIQLYLVNDINDLENGTISHFNISDYNLQLNKINYKIDDCIQYELVINFGYLKYLLFNETIKSDKKTIYQNIINKDYKKKDTMYFIIIIHSHLNNENQLNYLNLKVL